MKRRTRTPLEDNTPTPSNGPERRRGTFRPGNKAAAGRGSKAIALDKAVRDSCTPEELQAVARKLLERAQRGHVRAAALLFDRAIGRALPAERAAPPIELRTSSAEECVASHASIFAQLAAGALTIDQARELSALLVLARDSILLVEHEERLRTLEDRHAEES